MKRIQLNWSRVEDHGVLSFIVVDKQLTVFYHLRYYFIQLFLRKIQLLLDFVFLKEHENSSDRLLIHSRVVYLDLWMDWTEIHKKISNPRKI